MFLFADDAKLFARFVKYSDGTGLKLDLNGLFDWSSLWQLHFKSSKCMVMYIGNRNPHFGYNINGHELEELEQHKDLGVLFDQSLKFHSHVAKAIAKINMILGLIKRSFVFLNGLH